MFQRSTHYCAGLLLAAVTLSSIQVFAKSLPSDSRVKSGKLKNGVSWMYRQHDNPPGKMSLLVHVDSGSLNETDAQRGLAHFMEHMAFNGSEHFPPGELIPYFESIGMEFGADLNAFTSFDQTAYMLFIPEITDKQISDALKVLSDQVFRATLVAEEIEKERGVVLEEMRLGKNAYQRVRDELWPELFAGTRFAERLPIGIEEVLKNAPRSEFVDYYRTWYRPENVTVILVGDAEPERITPLIEEWFGEYKPDVPARKHESAGFKSFTSQRAMVMTDPELSNCEVELLNIRPGRAPTTTVEQWRTELLERLGSWIVGRRFEELVQKGEASFQEAGANVRNFFHDGLLINASATGEPENWNKMLDELVVEINRVREHGFTRRELELAKKEFLSDAERAVETEPTLNARRLAFGILRRVNAEEPVLSAAQRLELTKDLLPSIQLSELSASFAGHFEPGTFAFVVTTPDKEGVPIPSRDEFMAAARAAMARKTQPPVEEQRATEILAAMPAPGKVVESETDKDLNITSAWLSNGVRVHHREMDYKKDTVWVSVSLAGGAIEETVRNAGITEVATLAFSQPATSRLTSSEIKDIMTGRKVTVSATADEDDAFMVTISGSPQDLEIGFQLAHALLTDAKIEESAFKNWKQESIQRYEFLSKLPQAQAFWEIGEIIGGGDPRVTFLTPEKIESQTVSAAQAWLDRLCREAPIEVAVVGDISLSVVMPLVEKYIGSLSQRRRNVGNLDPLRKLGRKPGPHTREIKVDTMNPQGIVMFGFFGSDFENLADRRALSVAAQILSSQLIKKIREELSLVYSTRARHRAGETYDDSGMFLTFGPCDPKNVDRVHEEAKKIYDAFAKNGPTDEELSNARKQIHNNLDTEMKEPRFWWSALQHHTHRDKNLDELKNIQEYYDGITADQIRDAFNRYYIPARTFHVIAVPAAEPAEPTKQPEPAGVSS